MKTISILKTLAIIIIFSITGISHADMRTEWKHRIELFKGMGKNMRVLKQAENTNVMFEAAKIINLNAKKLSNKNLWTNGSGGELTRAKPEIWKNFPDFMSKFKSLEKTSSNLIEITQNGDLDRSKTAFKQMARTCGSCHRDYRGPKKW